MATKKNLPAEQHAGLPVEIDAEVAAMLAQTDTRQGAEEAGSDAYAMPFLTILQSGSPQVKRGSSQQIEGATEGMLLNTATNETHSGETGVNLVPVYYRQAFVEWIPRLQGGGFVAEHSPATRPVTKVDPDTGRDVMSSGNELVDTRYHYCVRIIDLERGVFEPVVIAAASTGVKKSKRWMSQMDQVRYNGQPLPRTFQIWNATTVVEQKDQYTWSNWAFKYVAPVSTRALATFVREFYERLRSGDAAKINHDAMNAAVGDGAVGEEEF